MPKEITAQEGLKQFIAAIDESISCSDSIVLKSEEWHSLKILIQAAINESKPTNQEIIDLARGLESWR